MYPLLLGLIAAMKYCHYLFAVTNQDRDRHFESLAGRGLRTPFTTFLPGENKDALFILLFFLDHHHRVRQSDHPPWVWMFRRWSFVTKTNGSLLPGVLTCDDDEVLPSDLCFVVRPFSFVLFMSTLTHRSESTRTFPSELSLVRYVKMLKRVIANS